MYHLISQHGLRTSLRRRGPNTASQPNGATSAAITDATQRPDTAPAAQ